LNIKRLLSLAILSTIIVVVLISIGDLGKLIEESTSENQTIDLGIVRDCNPSIAVCSYTGKINGQLVKISMNIDELILVDKSFPINLQISGLNVDQINAVKVSLDLAGVDILENQQHMQIKSTNENKPSSLWFTKIKIPQSVKNRKDWLAIIKISINKELYQLIFQLQVG